MLKYLHQTATCITRPADSRMLAFIPAKAATAMAHFKSEQVSGPDHNTLVWLGDVEWNDFVVWTMLSTRQLSTTMTGRLPWSPRRMAMCLMIRTVLTKNYSADEEEPPARPTLYARDAMSSVKVLLNFARVANDDATIDATTSLENIVEMNCVKQAASARQTTMLEIFKCQLTWCIVQPGLHTVQRMCVFKCTL